MMNAAAFTDSWLRSPSLRTQFQNQCAAAGHDGCAFISCGSFLPNGKPDTVSASREASMALDAGADIVFQLPVIAVLGGYDTAAFAALTLCDRISCSSRIAVPVSGLSQPLLEEISMFLFREPLPYQKQVRALMSEGKKFTAARAEALGLFVPGARDALLSPLNASAVGLQLAALRRFSSVKLVLFEAGMSEKDGSLPSDNSKSDDWDLRLAEVLAAFIRDLPEDDFRSAAQMTPSLPWSVSEKMISSKESFLNCSSFSDMARFLEGGKLSAQQIRRGLLMLLLGIRLPNLSIAGLDAFSPYVRVAGLTGDEGKAAGWKDALRAAEVPVIVCGSEKSYGPPLDESRKRLAGFDEAADALWEKIKT